MALPNKLETKRLVLRPLTKDDFSIFSTLLKINDVSNDLEFILKRKQVINIEN